MPLDLVVVRPFEDRLAGELGAIARQIAEVEARQRAEAKELGTARHVQEGFDQRLAAKAAELAAEGLQVQAAGIAMQKQAADLAQEKRAFLREQDDGLQMSWQLPAAMAQTQAALDAEQEDIRTGTQAMANLIDQFEAGHFSVRDGRLSLRSVPAFLKRLYQTPRESRTTVQGLVDRFARVFSRAVSAMGGGAEPSANRESEEPRVKAVKEPGSGV